LKNEKPKDSWDDEDAEDDDVKESWEDDEEPKQVLSLFFVFCHLFFCL